MPALLGVGLAVVMTWPLALNLRSDIPQDLVDPLLLTWQFAWIGHAVVHQPLDLFQANWFWPEADSLAFTDAMLGYLPAGLVSAQGAEHAVAAYNLMFLFAYALAFLGAFLLARELGVSRLAAVVGGAAFAYAPYRLAQDGHLHVISSGGIPLALFLLVRGYRRRSPGLVFCGWLITAWQVTLGFTLGVPLVYLIAALGVLALAYWLRRGRPALGMPIIAATALGACVVAATVYLQAQPYLRVADEHPESTRTAEYVAQFSPPIRGFLAASQDSFLWSGPTEEVWNSLRVPGEQALFPGLAILLFAALGVLGRSNARPLRVWLAAGTLACALLSLGLRNESDPAHSLMPYRLLFELAPGWDAFRTPGRLHTLTTLGLALLAAFGTDLILREVRSRPLLRERRPRGSRGHVAAVATAALLTALVLIEGLGPTQHPHAPTVPSAQLGAAEPQLHLPSEDAIDSRYAYWSIGDFPRVVNGSASFQPRTLAQVRRQTTTFPDRQSVGLLREIGVRTVVLHLDLVAGTPWEGAPGRPTKGLPVSRKAEGDVVIYHLRP